ncbi:MAG: glycoside hydrolase family 44 protein [Gemmataceae bacterium]
MFTSLTWHRRSGTATPPVRSFRPLLELLEDRIALDVAIAVDAALGRHPIDPNVYGTAWADRAALIDLNLPLNRAGGNTTTRYNWQQNASNHAADWYFESISDDGTLPGQLMDRFIADAEAAGADASVTVPMLGWVAKLAANRDKLASYSVAKYGAQQSTDYWMPDAGNGILANGTAITWNDPNDANVPADVAFQRGWVQHLLDRWGNAAAGGVRYYNLDNEPSIWHESHRDVHPTGATMEEVRDQTIAYATMIKALDPNALVLGPEEWGWSGYFWSGYDQQQGSRNGWSSFPDRAAHGNRDYLPWLLDQLRQHDAATGQRLLDYFTVHYYPQGGEFSDTVTRSMQRLRNRATRSLWDPNYTDTSWINDRVQLIPRLQSWVSACLIPRYKSRADRVQLGRRGTHEQGDGGADVLGISAGRGWTWRIAGPLPPPVRRPTWR